MFLACRAESGSTGLLTYSNAEEQRLEWCTHPAGVVIPPDPQPDLPILDGMLLYLAALPCCARHSCKIPYHVQTLRVDDLVVAIHYCPPAPASPRT